jgi:hypothetical protein
MGRKKLEKKLINKGVRLTEYQIAYLELFPSAAEIIRCTLDEKIIDSLLADELPEDFSKKYRSEILGFFRTKKI